MTTETDKTEQLAEDQDQSQVDATAQSAEDQSAETTEMTEAEAAEAALKNMDKPGVDAVTAVRAKSRQENHEMALKVAELTGEVKAYRAMGIDPTKARSEASEAAAFEEVDPVLKFAEEFGNEAPLDATTLLAHDAWSKKKSEFDTNQASQTVLETQKAEIVEINEIGKLQFTEEICGVGLGFEDVVRAGAPYLTELQKAGFTKLEKSEKPKAVYDACLEQLSKSPIVASLIAAKGESSHDGTETDDKGSEQTVDGKKKDPETQKQTIDKVTSDRKQSAAVAFATGAN